MLVSSPRDARRARRSGTPSDQIASYGDVVEVHTLYEQCDLIDLEVIEVTAGSLTSNQTNLRGASRQRNELDR